MEYQIDMFSSRSPTPTIGLARIDVFTKYAVVVPIDNKQPEDIPKGVCNAVTKMGKTPKIFIQMKKVHLLQNISKSI